MKTHIVEFEDGSANASGHRNDGISLSFSGEETLERLDVSGVPFISGNRAGLVRLGEILIQIGLSEYENGFHLHLRQNFDEEADEVLIVGLTVPE